jgi:hypothetical protein
VVEKGPELAGFLYDRLVSETSDQWFGRHIGAFFSGQEIPFPGNWRYQTCDQQSFWFCLVRQTISNNPPIQRVLPIGRRGPISLVDPPFFDHPKC